VWRMVRGGMSALRMAGFGVKSASAILLSLSRMEGENARK
jgi:hypothetical protein